MKRLIAYAQKENTFFGNGRNLSLEWDANLDCGAMVSNAAGLMRPAIL